MKREEILNIFRELARSQGSYGRMLEQINNMDTIDRNKLFKKLESENFKQPIDLIMYIEG